MNSVLNKLDILKPWQIALLSSVFLIAGWPPLPTFPLLFVGIFLLLILEERLEKSSGKKFFGHFYLAHLLWNIGTTWWVYKASLGGAIFMLLANSALQVIPWALYRFSKKTIGPQRSLFLWVCYYVGFEHFHHLWDISWPWLTLGNSLGSAVAFAQFYEYTGVAGGTLWILLGAAALYHHKKNRITWLSVGLVIIIPALISLGMFWSQSFEQKEELKVGIIQPNFEPHNEKFSIPPMKQLDTIISQMEIVAQKGAKLIVLPETALVDGFDEEYAYESTMIRSLRLFIDKYPEVSIIGGTDSYRIYETDETATARQSKRDPSMYFDIYNSAFFIDKDSLQTIYHKAKLVPGTEIMPYPGLLSFLDKIMISLDGTPNSLGRDYKITNYKLQDSSKIAPNICYESIYGDWTAKFARAGANYIAIMSNDGWWGKTYGYHQLFDYGKLRAIENRRWIVRSGNTGISGVISPKGIVSQETKFWERTQVNASIYKRSELTLYTRWGDFLNRTLFLVSLFVIPGLIVRRVLRKKD